MKKRINLTIILSIFFASSIFAQSIEITPFYGYTLNGKVRTYYGDYNVSNSPNYGGILSIGLSKYEFIEFMYNRYDTDFRYVRNGITQSSIDLATEYYQLGFLKQVDASEKVKPFGVFTLGATRFIPKDSYDWDGNGSVTKLNDAWAFSATIGAGLKILVSDRIGVRLQARLLLPMRFEGVFIGIGTGGTSGGASFSVPLLAGDFTAGLVFRLGD